MAPSATRPTKPLPDHIPVSSFFLEIFHDCFARYRVSKERDRLLAGISPDRSHRAMTVRSAVLLVCCIAAARQWRTSETRTRKYRDARWRSEEHPLSRARFDGIETIRKQSTLWEINRIEALAALSFSHQAGYSTHSRTLWSCIEGALRTDALGEPPRVVRSLDDINEHFEKIRLRLYHQRKRKGDAAVAAEADGIYRELLLKLRDRSLKDPRDDLLLKALHRPM